jgi:PhnB protein
MKLIPYLNFQGNTEEVMNHYKEIFNGTIHDVSRFGDGNFPMPEEQKSKIMHARLTFGDNMLMFSDGMPGSAITHGDGIHLSIGLTDEAQARSIFDQLAEGGNVKMPMEKQFWGALYGQVIDKYGISWMINCEL